MTVVANNWTASDLGYDRSRYPRVPDVGRYAYGCGAGEPTVGYMCARPKGHTGRHLARGNGQTVHAVWGDE